MPALTTAEIVARARAVHGDRYDYSATVYVHSAVKVTVICREHGPFSVLAHNHINKRVGCRRCSIRAPYTTETFIERARKRHGDRFDYRHVKIVNSYTPVTIVCPVHGEFRQIPISHVRGSGCRKCGGGNRRGKISADAVRGGADG